MANTFLTSDIIAREALMRLENNMVMSNLVSRGIQTEFEGRNQGDTVKVRVPATFTADKYDGATQVIQDATESTIQVVLEEHLDVSVKVTDKDMSLSVEDFGNQFLEGAALALAEGVDSYICQKALDESWNHVGTAGDPPDSIADIALINKDLADNKAPRRPRYCVVDPQGEADLWGISEFAKANERGDGGTALREAELGMFMGLNWFMDQNIKTHTAGTFTANVTVTGANAIGAVSIDLTTDATGDFDLTKGDVLTFAGDTQKYVLTADSPTVGNSSNGAVAISPPLKVATSGSEAVTFSSGTTDHVGNLAFHSNAIVLAAAPLILPQGAGSAAIVQNRGLGMRVVYTYDSNKKSDVVSMDVLVGAKVQQGEVLTRVLG